MPTIIYKLLFTKNNMKDNQISVILWEVIRSGEHIALKLVGFDLVIALYNVRDEIWRHNFFSMYRIYLKTSQSKTMKIN